MLVQRDSHRPIRLRNAVALSTYPHDRGAAGERNLLGAQRDYRFIFQIVRTHEVTGCGYGVADGDRTRSGGGTADGEDRIFALGDL